MLLIKQTRRFEKSLTLSIKRGKNLDKMEAVVDSCNAVLLCGRDARITHWWEITLG